MEKHLGRNPFERRKRMASRLPDREEVAQANAHPTKKTAEWFLVDLPAGSFMFALKTVLFVKAVFEKNPRS